MDGKFTAEEQGHIKATSGKVIQQRRKWYKKFGDILFIF